MISFTSALTLLAISTAFSSVLAAPSSQHDQLRRRNSYHAAPQWVKRRSLNQNRAAGISGALNAELLAVSNVTASNTTTANATASTKGSKNATSSAVEFNTTALWFNETGAAGACRNVSTNDEFVIGLSTLFWNNTGDVSPLCGEKVVITSGNKSVTATVLDASGNSYTTLTIAAFSALGNLTLGMIDISFSFVNQNLTSLLPTPIDNRNGSLWIAGTSSSAAISTPTVAIAQLGAMAGNAQAASSSSAAAAAAYAASTAADAAWASSSSSSASAAASSAASVSWAAQQAASSAAGQRNNVQFTQASSSSTYYPPSSTYYAPSSTYYPPSSTSTYYPPPSSTYYPPTPSSSAPAASGGSEVYTGGDATFFYQNGVAGACGVVHSEDFKGIAIDQAMYAGGSNCWRYIQVTNTQSGATVVAQVVDMCPTCNSGTSLDLSVGAFNAIASESQGMVPITWQFV